MFDKQVLILHDQATRSSSMHSPAFKHTKGIVQGLIQRADFLRDHLDFHQTIFQAQKPAPLKVNALFMIRLV